MAQIYAIAIAYILHFTVSSVLRSSHINTMFYWKVGPHTINTLGVAAVWSTCSPSCMEWSVTNNRRAYVQNVSQDSVL